MCSIAICECHCGRTVQQAHFHYKVEKLSKELVHENGPITHATKHMTKIDVHYKDHVVKSQVNRAL